MSWRDLIALPRRVAEIYTDMKELVRTMADDITPVLTGVAQGLADLGPKLSALLAENAELRARNAELEGTEATQSAAATDVKAAYDNVAGLLTAEPSAPDVEPLPEPEPEPGPAPTE